MESIQRVRLSCPSAPHALAGEWAAAHPTTSFGALFLVTLLTPVRLGRQVCVAKRGLRVGITHIHPIDTDSDEDEVLLRDGKTSQHSCVGGVTQWESLVEQNVALSVICGIVQRYIHAMPRCLSQHSNAPKHSFNMRTMSWVSWKMQMCRRSQPILCNVQITEDPVRNYENLRG